MIESMSLGCGLVWLRRSSIFFLNVIKKRIGSFDFFSRLVPVGSAAFGSLRHHTVIEFKLAKVAEALEAAANIKAVTISYDGFRKRYT